MCVFIVWIFVLYIYIDDMLFEFDENINMWIFFNVVNWIIVVSSYDLKLERGYEKY